MRTAREEPFPLMRHRYAQNRREGGSDMSEGTYDVAQICLNGHVINSSARSSPQHNQEFCDKCGARTVTRCPNCDAPIRGDYESYEVVIIPGHYSRPSYCHNCGKPYPWTDTKLKAARELSEELSSLTPQEKELLKRSLDDIVQDNPRTTLAAMWVKRLLGKAGKEEASNALKAILIDIVSEAVRKQIWG